MNTPKELRTAAEHVAAHPEWLVVTGSARWASTRRTSTRSTAGPSRSRRVDKPWGYELIWALTDIYCGKVLFVKAGQSLSLQFHREKDESWLVQSGRAKLELGEVGDDDAEARR